VGRPPLKSAHSRFLRSALAPAIVILQLAVLVPRAAQSTPVRPPATSSTVSASATQPPSPAGAGARWPGAPVPARYVSVRPGAVVSSRASTVFASIGSGRDAAAAPALPQSSSISRAVPPPLLATLPPNFNIGTAPAGQAVVDGSSTSYTISIHPLRGFADPVTLTVAGLPDGANGSFSPNPTSSSSTLTVATTRGTPPGSYLLAVTGASGPIAHTAYLTLTTTPAPDFSLAGSPSSQSVSAGNGAGYTVTVQPSNGFSDAVSLSIAGLPSGGQGVFGTNPTATSSGLAVTTSRTTPQGSYTLTITGTSGPLTHSTSVTLVVGPPDLCGAPANPWDYNFCVGNVIYSPPSNFCSYFNCIASFWISTNGYVAECIDGTYSHSGGVQGACSSHGGVWRALLGP